MILSRYGKKVSRCRKAVLKRRTEIPMTVRKFSLVELFCTISIIILLAAVLLATLNKARNSAKSVSCLGNMKQSMTYLLMYLDTYEAVHTQRWSDYLLANGFVPQAQTSALRCPAWKRENDNHKNVFGIRRVVGDTHTLNITGSPADYVLLTDSLNLDTLQQFINFYGNYGPYKLVVHYRHNNKANTGFLDGSARGCFLKELSSKGCPRYAY